MNEGGHITEDLAGFAKQHDSQWLTAAYSAGDVLLHSPYMIHAAQTNRRTDGVIRLSLDIRFQDINTQLDERWLQHWQYNDGL